MIYLCMNVNSIAVLIWGHWGILCSWENLLQLISLARTHSLRLQKRDAVSSQTHCEISVEFIR